MHNCFCRLCWLQPGHGGAVAGLAKRKLPQCFPAHEGHVSISGESLLG